MFERFRKIHFVGIGGIGMSGIAEVLHNLGYEVTGSDMKESQTTRRLQSLGIRVSSGHAADNISAAHVVVISSAVSEDNPEVIAARSQAIPVIPRAEMLAELARLKYGILVAGAHGKTTTTSLISTILSHAGLDPTVVIGGRLKATGRNASLGQGEFLVAEADESDGSFLKLSPTVAVVTNIDKEHMDFFKTMNLLKEAFVAFINKVPFYGAAILCMDNEYMRELLPYVHRRHLTYGFAPGADFTAINIKKAFMSVTYEVLFKNRNIGEFFIPVPGMHNVLNSLAAIAAAMELRIDVSLIRDALKGFAGIQRRFELKGQYGGIKVFDDYGHHPAEIRATLRAAREGLFADNQETQSKIPEKGRLFVMFQPHRYTRTRDLMNEFSASFGDADSIILLDIYSAGEQPIEGVTAEALHNSIKKTGFNDIVHIKNREEAVTYAISRMKEGDVLMTLGAGDVWKLGETVLKQLSTQQQH
jgi:UDP-N-acetylmuramate--alanine ligase